jgi:hypothetical protein
MINMHKDDGKNVVVQDGKRVSGQLHEKLEDAQKEADQVNQKRPVTESGKPATQPAKVVKNLLG